MKATPGCRSIRVWQHFELIFLSLESRSPILLLITALIHNQAHPLPAERAGKYKKITVEDSWLAETRTDVEVITGFYSRFTDYRLTRQFISIRSCLLFLQFLYRCLSCSVFLWSRGCVYTLRLIDFHDSRSTSHLSCFICLSSPTEGPLPRMKFSPDPRDLWVQRLSPVQWPQTTPGLL